MDGHCPTQRKQTLSIFYIGWAGARVFVVYPQSIHYNVEASKPLGEVRA